MTRSINPLNHVTAGHRSQSEPTHDNIDMRLNDVVDDLRLPCIWQRQRHSRPS